MRASARICIAPTPFLLVGAIDRGVHSDQFLPVHPDQPASGIEAEAEHGGIEKNGHGAHASSIALIVGHGQGTSLHEGPSSAAHSAHTGLLRYSGSTVCSSRTAMTWSR